MEDRFMWAMYEVAADAVSFAPTHVLIVVQVDYGATPEELQAHFQSCGTINRITILCDKFTGHPKGYVLYLRRGEEKRIEGCCLGHF
jgi:RNA recognition motif. (a.k.a. RRM, RBD, or RNP domain)